jgi:hypothetical protein
MAAPCRIGALALGAVLALGWSSSAQAQFRGKKGGGHPVSVVKKKSAPVQAHAQGGRLQGSGLQGGRPQGGRLGGARPQGPGIAPHADARAPRQVQGPARIGQTGGRPVPAGRVATAGAPAARRTVSVPPTLRRGGTTFSQKVVVHENETYVERTRSDRGGIDRDGHGHHGYAHHDHESRHYRHHGWGHHYYDCYVHTWPYEPWFWGFYFAPFPAPWHYTWVWVGDPWYATWGWYWAPYPYYVGPSYWVTDYVMARMLEDEYARGYAAGYASGEQAAGFPVSEPVKEQLRTQVDETATAFKDDRAIELDSALAKPGYLFVVDAPLSVATQDSASCNLTGGDIIKAAAGGDPDVAVASMVVVTAKRENCAAGSQVSVSYTDLQEMLNSFGEKVDDGMKELEKQNPPGAAKTE